MTSASAPPSVAPASPTKLRKALVAVALAGLLAGAGQAVVWALIVPRQRWIVYTNGTFLSLPTESSHRFAGLGLFALMSAVIGIVLAVASWQLKFARGLNTLLALGVGVAAGSGVALWLGPLIVGGVIPADVAKTPPAVDTLVTMIPGISWVLVCIAPLAAVGMYTFLAVWHPEPDLGTGGVACADITQPIPIVGGR